MSRLEGVKNDKIFQSECESWSVERGRRHVPRPSVATRNGWGKKNSFSTRSSYSNPAEINRSDGVEKWQNFFKLKAGLTLTVGGVSHVTGRSDQIPYGSGEREGKKKIHFQHGLIISIQWNRIDWKGWKMTTFFKVNPSFWTRPDAIFQGPSDLIQNRSKKNAIST